MTIVKLADKRPALDPDLVRICQTLLDRAKSGDIVGLTFAAELPSGAFTTSIGSTGDRIKLVGILGYMHWRSQLTMFRDREPAGWLDNPPEDAPNA